MRRSVRVILFAAGISWTSSVRVCQATTTFPTEVRDRLALASTPDCGLCHTTGASGGRGTVNTPFGVSVREHGARAYDAPALRTALDALRDAGTDSDGDGVPDIEELENGRDPNAPSGPDGNSSAVTPEPPRYGCRVHSGRALEAVWPLLLMVVIARALRGSSRGR